MYLGGKTLAGIVAIGVVALFLLSAVFAAPVDARSPFANSAAKSTVASADHPSAAASHVTPAAGPTIKVVINTVYAATTTIPTKVNFTVTWTGATFNNTTATMGWNVSDTMTGVVCAAGSFTYVLTATPETSPATFNLTLSLKNFSTAQLNCPKIATDVDMLNVSASVTNATGVTVAASAVPAETSFVLPTTLTAAITSTIPTTTYFPLTVDVKITVTDAVISTTNLTVTWAVLNATGTGACAAGSFSYLVKNTTLLTETIAGTLYGANFTGVNLLSGCTEIFATSLNLTVTGVINGTGPFAAPTGNWATDLVVGSGSVYIIPTGVQVIVSTVLPIYTQLSTTVTPVDFTVQVASANITPANLSVWANITDHVTGALCGVVNLDSLVVASSTPIESFEWDMSTATVPSSAKLAVACPSILTSADLITIGAKVNGTGSWFKGTFAESDSTATGTTPVTSLVFTALTGQLGFATTSTEYTYNVSATFSGQYIGRVALTLLSPTGVVVFSANLFSPTYTSWYEPKAATYSYSLVVFAPYGNDTTSGVIALTAPIPIYYNTTTWHNSSSFAGLSPAVGGTILLVVGLIIGMIVAFLLGAAVFRKRETPPPQAWEGGKGTEETTGGAPPTEETTGKTS